MSGSRRPTVRRPATKFGHLQKKLRKLTTPNTRSGKKK